MPLGEEGLPGFPPSADSSQAWELAGFEGFEFAAEAQDDAIGVGEVGDDLRQVEDGAVIQARVAEGVGVGAAHVGGRARQFLGVVGRGAFAIGQARVVAGEKYLRAEALHGLLLTSDNWQGPGWDCQAVHVPAARLPSGFAGRHRRSLAARSRPSDAAVLASDC